MIGFVTWLTLGGTAGWLASVLLRHSGQQHILMNIVTGIVGAYAGGTLIAPALRAGPAGGYAIAIGAAVLLIAMFTALRRRGAR